MTRSSIVVAALACLFPLFATAHSGSASYIDVRDAGRDVQAKISLDLRDVQYALDLDANDDNKITWGELRSKEASLAALVLQRLSVARDGRACSMRAAELAVDHVLDAPFAVIDARLTCAATGTLQVRSDLLFDLDVNHRALLEWHRGETTNVAVLSRANRVWQAPAAGVGSLAQLVDFIGEGMWHIWTGFDHLAFLLVLLLPTFIARQGSTRHFEWPRLLGIVSAFTLAHSITLILAALRIVTLPERPIEIAIAASVVLAALLNLRNRAHAVGVLTAFGFGLLHGFGFASALQGLEAGRASLALALAGFNLGVEAGQLVIVAAAMPLLLYLARRSVYASRVVPGVSLAIAALGAGWIWERAAS